MTAAVPDPRFRDQLAKALAQRICEAEGFRWADMGQANRGHFSRLAKSLLPLIDAEVEARGQAAANQRAVLRPFEELFSGDPDTSCRTTWRREPGWSLPGSTAALTECVEVPMDDLRDAFDRAAALASPTPALATDEEADDV